MVEHQNKIIRILINNLMIKFFSIHTCIYIYNFEDCLTNNDCQVHTALRQICTIHVFYIESRLRILRNLLFIAKGSTDAKVYL
jgi:hypothetical protein